MPGDISQGGLVMKGGSNKGGCVLRGERLRGCDERGH